MADLLRHLEHTLRQRPLLPAGRLILVAVSGGLDSLVLLHVLHQLAPAGRWRLAVAHFNHQLRGRASDADERLVRETARGLGLRCLVGRASVRHHAEQRRVSLEMAGRQLRHDFLARTARRLGTDTVALAHHADDQVELFFLRLLRGAGGGIAGMTWAAPSPSDPGVRLVRPLLDLPKTELAAFAAATGIRHREDASNRRKEFLRNRVRHELIPLLARRYQPAFKRTVSRLMQLVGDEHDFIDVTARAWLRRKSRVAFHRLHIALQRQCLRLQLSALRVPENFDRIERLRGSPGNPVMVAPGVTVSRDPTGVLRRARLPTPRFRVGGHREVELRRPAGLLVFSGVRIQWRRTTAGGQRRPTARAGLERFDADKVGKRIRLRHWRAGDRFQPSGMNQAAKLQDLFTNQKVPRHHRHEVVLATTGQDEIFWVEGLRISDRFKLDKGSRRCLKWQWQRLSAPGRALAGLPLAGDTDRLRVRPPHGSLLRT